MKPLTIADHNGQHLEQLCSPLRLNCMMLLRTSLTRYSEDNALPYTWLPPVAVYLSPSYRLGRANTDIARKFHWPITQGTTYKVV